MTSLWLTLFPQASIIQKMLWVALLESSIGKAVATGSHPHSLGGQCLWILGAVHSGDTEVVVVKVLGSPPVTGALSNVSS